MFGPPRSVAPVQIYRLCVVRRGVCECEYSEDGLDSFTAPATDALGSIPSIAPSKASYIRSRPAFGYLVRKSQLRDPSRLTEEQPTPMQPELLCFQTTKTTNQRPTAGGRNRSESFVGPPYRPCDEVGPPNWPSIGCPSPSHRVGSGRRAGAGGVRASDRPRTPRLRSRVIPIGRVSRY